MATDHNLGGGEKKSIRGGTSSEERKRGSGCKETEFEWAEKTTVVKDQKRKGGSDRRVE